jgi:uncharacterized protein GlcG (DUF336 family)
MKKKFLTAMALMMGSGAATAGNCPDITFTQLQNTLKSVVALPNGGLGFQMWATVVGKDGTVCLVAKSGTTSINDQWLGSRVISAQKASAANAFSTTVTGSGGGFALSTANLYSATQPNGTLYGLQASNPVDTSAAYSGNSANFGTALDPLVGRKVGGINVFGGGLALYDASHNLVGALGVSGDTSCADHNIAWRVRQGLGAAGSNGGLGYPVDNVPAGVGNVTGLGLKDNIEYLAPPQQSAPFNPTESPNGFKHPWCSDAAKTIADGFNTGQP